jgi:hypothetical protein
VIAGKSFTMSGFGEYLGINYRSVLKLFEILELKQKTANKDGAPGSASPLTFKVELSVLSVCREQVFDLLTGKCAFLATMHIPLCGLASSFWPRCLILVMLRLRNSMQAACWLPRTQPTPQP